jgi:hypothetical protein
MTAIILSIQKHRAIWFTLTNRYASINDQSGLLLKFGSLPVSQVVSRVHRVGYRSQEQTERDREEIPGREEVRSS